MLAAIDARNPLFWAILIGWILSVVLHEFAHGVVAYWGGDYTVRERGGLTLNPLQYIDPVMSLLLPAVVLFLGGVPLPGGVTYVRRDLLRSRFWDAAVSLAGPAMNFLLFLACVIPLHPRVGWIEPYTLPDAWTPGQRFLATMAILQMVSVLLNLVPIPPLDGFQAVSPFLNAETRTKLSTPPLSTLLFVGFFFVVWKVPDAYQLFYNGVDHMMTLLGFDQDQQDPIRKAYNMTLFR